MTEKELFPSFLTETEYYHKYGPFPSTASKALYDNYINNFNRVNNKNEKPVYDYETNNNL